MKVITLNLFAFLFFIILEITVSAGELIVGFDAKLLDQEGKEEIIKLFLIDGFTEQNNRAIDAKSAPQLFKRLAANDGMFFISFRKCQSSNNQSYIITEIINVYSGVILFYQAQEGIDIIDNFRGNKKIIFEAIGNYDGKLNTGTSQGVNLSILRNEPCNKLYSLFINHLIKTDNIFILSRTYLEECLLIQESFFTDTEVAYRQKDRKLIGAEVVCLIQEINESFLKIKTISVDNGTIIFEQTISSPSDMDSFIKNILRSSADGTGSVKRSQ